MNKIILIGRLTRDPEIYYPQNGNSPVARYSLAVEKKYKREDGVKADYFNIVAFGKAAEFAEKYLRQGIKMVVSGRVQTGSYEKSGIKIPFFEVVVEEQEFAESKNSGQAERNGGFVKPPNMDEYGHPHLPDDFPEEVPFA